MHCNILSEELYKRFMHITLKEKKCRFSIKENLHHFLKQRHIVFCTDFKHLLGPDGSLDLADVRLVEQ